MAHKHYIREWRRFRGLTMEQLADRIGLSHAVVSRIERGLQPYRQDFLEKVAEALRCEPAHLIMVDPLNADDPMMILAEMDPAKQAEAGKLLKAFFEARKSK